MTHPPPCLIHLLSLQGISTVAVPVHQYVSEYQVACFRDLMSVFSESSFPAPLAENRVPMSYTGMHLTSDILETHVANL